MKYTLISFEYITNETKTIENPTIDDLIKELSKAGCVNVNIFDENHNVVFNDYHEKLG